VTQRGAGVLEWTSPAGYSYIDRPPSPVTFTVDGPVDDPDPDPPWETRSGMVTARDRG
jgi:hypothetical protein